MTCTTSSGSAGSSRWYSRSVTRSGVFFFFSSRRRHTRLQGDWSSDVCSSDLVSAMTSEQEMCALFPDRPDVIAETARLAALCEFDFEKRYYLPQYPRPAEFASDTDLLVHLARDGARRRYGDPVPPEVEQRLQYELDVIARTGYARYVLIVSAP